MKDITVTVKLPAYLRQWLTHCMGNPVRFPRQSYENHLLHRLLWKCPRTGRPDAAGPPEGSVAVVVTDDRLHKPEFYNHLSRRAQASLAQAVESLFRIHLWSECCVLIHQRGGLNEGIDAWCARNGIALDYREGVRQKFYRIRRSYESCGIILGKKYQKKVR